jgi:predicted SAM-dependent methyltransferase
MKASLVEFVNATSAAAPGVESSNGYKADLEKLATAVAENALLNTEVDRKITAHVLQARQEIIATKGDVESLLRQVEHMVRGMAHVLEINRLERLNQAADRDQPAAATVSPAPRLIAPEKLLAMGADVRLNVGCGLIPLPDYLNVDDRELAGVDLVSNVRTLPFKAETVSEIYAAHLVEHFTEADLRTALLPAWHRMLKPGGILRVVVPDAEGMIQAFSRGNYPFENLRKVTFGGQDYPGNYHYTMFSRESLRNLLREQGFLAGEYTALGRANGLCLEMEIAAVRKS